MTETTLHGWRIIIITSRPDSLPPLAYIRAPALGERHDYTTVELDHIIRLKRQELEVMEVAETMLEAASTLRSVVSDSEQVGQGDGETFAGEKIE